MCILLLRIALIRGCLIFRSCCIVIIPLILWPILYFSILILLFFLVDLTASILIRLSLVQNQRFFKVLCWYSFSMVTKGLIRGLRCSLYFRKVLLYHVNIELPLLYTKCTALSQDTYLSAFFGHINVIRLLVYRATLSHLLDQT